MESTLINFSGSEQNKTTENIAKKEMSGQMAHESQPMAHEFQPNLQRICPLDKVGSAIDILPSHNQTMMFSAGEHLHGHIKLASSDHGSQAEQGVLSKDSVPVGQLMRPRSPTRQCAIPKTDSSHFSLALMESKVGSEASERIFHVQEHELICAISSQTSFVDSKGCLVSSIDINYYWCNFCTFSTATKTMLMQHVMEHRFHCKFCRYQSFSRADIIHHSVNTHPDFKETAAITQYCTLLSDYLRIHHPKQSQLDCQRKRKYVSNWGDDCNEKLRKVSVMGHDSGKLKTQEKYSADYVLFDVDVADTDPVVEKTGEQRLVKGTCSRSSSPPSLEEVRQVETLQSMENSSASSCSVLSTQSDSTVLLPKCNFTSESANRSTSLVSADDQHATQASPSSVFPPDLVPEARRSRSYHHQPGSCSGSNEFSGASLSSTPSPPNLSSIGAGAIQQDHSEWTCAYCTFTSASQKGIKRHCLRQHRGKPFKCISPTEFDERSAPPLLRYDGGKISSGVDKSFDTGSAEGKAFSVSHTFSVVAQATTENSHADEPPVLVKQNSVDSEKYDMPKVNNSVSASQTGNVNDLKCYHCSYRSQLLDELRSHIFSCHKAKSLNGLDAENNIVFICSKSSCTFTSSSGQSFLNHAQECIPWPQPVSTDFLEESLLQCLQATTRLAEHDMLTSSHSFLPSVTGGCKESAEEFACIYCENQFISTKSQVKQHILECHDSKCLFMRNVHAHSKRKKSSVYFCRWCLWEGDRKNDHDLHAVFCPHQSKAGASFSDQTNSQASRLACGFRNKKEHSCSNVASRTNSDDLYMQLAEEDEAHGDSTHDVHTLPPVTSSAETSNVCSESNDTDYNQECDDALGTNNFLPSRTADDKKSPADTLTDHDLEDSMLETLAVPKLNADDDSSRPADKFQETEQHFDLTLTSPHHTTISHSYMHQTGVPRINTTDTDTLLAHSPLYKTNTAQSYILPDIKSDSIDTSDTLPGMDTINNNVNSGTPDISSVSHTKHPGCIFPDAANDSVNPPDISPQTNIDGKRRPQSNVPPDTSSVENRVCPSLPDISSSGKYMDTEHIHIDLTATDSNHSTYSADANPVKSIVDNDVCAAQMSEDSNIVGDSMYSTHSSSDIKVSPNSTHQRLTGNTADECLGFSVKLHEQGHGKEHLSCTPAHASSAEGSSEPADSSHSLQHGVVKQASHFSSEDVLYKHKDQFAKAAGSHRKKVKNIWCDGCKIECFKCSFHSDSLVSLKAHIRSGHSDMISFPFRSVHHRDMHYKCNFFACPLAECLVYNYNESSVVSHYRQCHGSQPHPYVDSRYVPAPVKSRRRTNAKPRDSRKPHADHLCKVQTESTEQTYMCLYCEEKIYTDTVSEMKAHHLSCHMGQPITIRNVSAHREKKASRFFVCDQPQCDFCTYEMNTLEKHMQVLHSEQLLALADRSYQCVSCGWITSEYAKVQKHVTVMHESEGGATVVTLAHGDEQRAVEERYIVCMPDAIQA